jgi:hypothetical protein
MATGLRQMKRSEQSLGQTYRPSLGGTVWIDAGESRSRAIARDRDGDANPGSVRVCGALVRVDADACAARSRVHRARRGPSSFRT